MIDLNDAAWATFWSGVVAAVAALIGSLGTLMITGRREAARQKAHWEREDQQRLAQAKRELYAEAAELLAPALQFGAYKDAGPTFPIIDMPELLRRGAALSPLVPRFALIAPKSVSEAASVAVREYINLLEAHTVGAGHFDEWQRAAPSAVQALIFRSGNAALALRELMASDIAGATPELLLGLLKSRQEAEARSDSPSESTE